MLEAEAEGDRLIAFTVFLKALSTDHMFLNQKDMVTKVDPPAPEAALVSSIEVESRIQALKSD